MKVKMCCDLCEKTAVMSVNDLEKWGRSGENLLCDDCRSKYELVETFATGEEFRRKYPGEKVYHSLKEYLASKGKDEGLSG